MLTFILISVGGALAFSRFSANRILLKRVFLLFLFMLSGFLSFWDIFVGPIGDAQRYHQAINQCFFGSSMFFCGEKFHENFWGFFSSIIGPAWALIYGYIIFGFLIKLLGVATRAGVFSLFALLYSAYQIGNGMGEGTYFILGFLAIQALHSNKIFIGSIFFSFLTIGHLGNLPSWLLMLTKRTGVIIVILIFIFSFLGAGLVLDYINKASVVTNTDLVQVAIENKLNQSIEEATTSYANILILFGFPVEFSGYLLALVLYIAPVIVVSGGIGGWIVSLIGTVFSVGIFRLAGRNKLMWLLVILSFILFSVASYTPGISLRHKVPLFLLMCTYFYFMNKKEIKSNSLFLRK